MTLNYTKDDSLGGVLRGGIMTWQDGSGASHPGTS
jgi:hypothetical protein